MTAEKGVENAGEGEAERLSALYLGGVGASGGQALSVETLLDILVVLYDGACSSTLRREKSVSEFVEFMMIFSQ